MAAQISTGSPKMSRKATPVPRLADDNIDKKPLARGTIKSVNAKLTIAMPLQSDSLSNLQPTNQTSFKVKATDALPCPNDGMNHILAHLRQNETRKPSPNETKVSPNPEPGVFDQLLSNLSNQNGTLKKQETELKDTASLTSRISSDATSSADSGNINSNSEISRHTLVARQTDESEVQRMKSELEAARSVISRQEYELAESRNLKHTMEQAMGPMFEADQPAYVLGPQSTDMNVPNTFNASARPFTSCVEGSWLHEDHRSNQTAYPTTTGRGRASFGNQAQAPRTDGLAYGIGRPPYLNTRNPAFSDAGYSTAYNAQTSPMDLTFGNRTFSGSAKTYGMDERIINEYTVGRQHPVLGRNARSNSILTDPLSPALAANAGVPPVNATTSFGYNRGYGPTPLSPLSPDFPPLAGHTLIPTSMAHGNTYISPLEPMNYRRLLDKSVSCDWKYIVDKIVCNNDQQASIFLQQKLKVGTAEQKFEIVESIVNQAYPLMINRFGNFLVQRCFEHGTPDQIIAIADAIHGNVISLSMDPFGCHVIQKAFDSVPEEHKANMVRELLRRIPDTVIHRYACHVWQKLFELRWSGEPPQIMLKVNEALQGMWHEVALGETGSLVVQNIFENCVEEEKRPAIEEVITNIDLIAHGQFGNWCIQHLCEHGSPSDKRRVIDHILANSYSYSIDQFASKVVEKCLKISGPEFLERFLGVITTARPDRPRIPLIDIAGDQYGNYLIQWILMNTHQHQREQVAVHIRKHMVSLRGSKFGSRVAMLCSNPAAVTRPGPPPTLVNPYAISAQPARAGWPRYR